jgi:hypothetical protein
MAPAAVSLSISIYEDKVRLVVLGKTGSFKQTVEYTLNVTQDDGGLRGADPYEVVYFVRTGMQTLLQSYKIWFHHIGIGVMPGYVMAWDKESATPMGLCYLPHSVIPKEKYRAFKYSKFYDLLHESVTSGGNIDTAFNMWHVSQSLAKKSESVCVSGIDTWLVYFLTGYSEAALVSHPSMFSGLLFDNEWDQPLINALGIDLAYLPQLSNSVQLEIRHFTPCKDGIPIVYVESTDQLVASMLQGYTDQPVACLHVGHVNQLHVQQLGQNALEGSSVHECIRFLGWDAFYKQCLLQPLDGGLDVSMDDLTDAMAISLHPFRLFDVPQYHFMHISDMASDTLYKLGVFQVLFLIKYCLASMERHGGHIQSLMVTGSQWHPSVVQLCVDLCQVSGLDFKWGHWLDHIHVCRGVTLMGFYSESVKASLYKIQTHYVPSLDPLTTYSLYQPWETWFNKLYDRWR